ncbi:MAG: Zn-dependent alcohol dehydrogenase [Chloroflexota bacterium]|nr:Zn-dependent alcohol dehydrogenase [Chloroflexota bacterium]
MQMQAAILNKANTPFSIETVELEVPKTGEVLIKMAAAGVCHSDWHVVEGLSYFPMPIICGHEGAGIVEAVGAGVARLSPGDHVTLSFRANCGSCFYCQNNKPNLCEVYTPVLRSGLLKDGSSRISRNGEPVHIMTGLGCFAEYVVIPEEACVPVRADVPLEIAALVGCAVSTGVGAAMYTADVRPGQSVAVYGAGGVGLNIIMGAVLCGADPIIAIDANSSKMEIAREFGATHTLYSDDSAVGQIQALTHGRGADHVFESVGLTSLQEAAFDATRPGGTLTLVGLTPVGSGTNLPGAVITRTEKVIRGSFYGSVLPQRDFPMFLDLYRNGKLMLDELVTRRYRLEEINEAYQDMLTGEVARGIIAF